MKKIITFNHHKDKEDLFILQIFHQKNGLAFRPSHMKRHCLTASTLFEHRKDTNISFIMQKKHARASRQVHAQ